MTAPGIAAALGSRRRCGSGWWSCRCPAHDDNSPSLSLRDCRRGLIVKCWAGCHPRDILAELRRRGLLGDAATRYHGELPDPEPRQALGDAEAAAMRRKLDLARDIWTSSAQAAGTMISHYLRFRDITIPVPSSIRFIGMHTPYGRHPPSGQRRPVMVAAVEHVVHGFVGVSRTFLTIDGSCKAALDPPRLFTGPVSGGAVRLGELQPDAPLVLAEGVESALAASEISGWPAWAALSAGGIARLTLPAEARDIVIAVDRDANGVGERAARGAAEKWLGEGRRVRLVIRTDLNDLLKETRHVAP
jgi:hypothetical protein